jgi:tyrosyl-tRNA synthetase
LNGAYCPEKKSKENPVMEICKLIIFPLLGELKVERPSKFGGDLSFEGYGELEQIYSGGKLHPLDLKNGVCEALEKIVGSIRKNFR